MKHIFSIFLLIIQFSNVYSQYFKIDEFEFNFKETLPLKQIGKVEKIETSHYNFTGSKIDNQIDNKEVKKYNKNGDIIEWITFQYQPWGELFSTYTKNYYYDSKIRISKIIKDTGYDESKITELFNYDTNGLLSSIENLYLNKSAYYKYSNGKLTEIFDTVSKKKFTYRLDGTFYSDYESKMSEKKQRVNFNLDNSINKSYYYGKRNAFDIDCPILSSIKNPELIKLIEECKDFIENDSTAITYRQYEYDSKGKTEKAISILCFRIFIDQREFYDKNGNIFNSSMRINNNGSIDNKESNHKYIFDLNGNWVSKKTEEYEPTEKAQSLKRSEIRRKFYYFN